MIKNHEKGGMDDHGREVIEDHGREVMEDHGREVMEVRLEKDERGLGLTVAGYICEKGEALIQYRWLGAFCDILFLFLLHKYCINLIKPSMSPNWETLWNLYAMIWNCVVVKIINKK